MNRNKRRYHISDLVAWEDGELNEDEEVSLFQSLIDSGDVWLLQGFYGRHAQYMIDKGLCHTLEAHTAEAAE